MAQRGRVLRDTKTGPGLVTVDGKQYTFTLEDMWRSDVPPRVGMFVEVSFDAAGAPEALHAVTEGQVAKEQAQKALAGALRHGETMKRGVLARFGVTNAFAMALLLISFFLFPNLRVGPSEFALSGWDGTGLNPATMMTNNQGLLSVLAIVCLFAPLVVPFVDQAWARRLYAAPLAFSIVYFGTIYHAVNSQAQAASSAVGAVFGSDAARMAGSQNSGMVSLAIGGYLVLLCGLFLAWQAAFFLKVKGNLVAAVGLSIIFSHGQVMRAQATASPEYAAAKATAIANWTNPPLSADAGKDAIGVLTRDANELNAAHTLYKTAPPVVQGAVDGSMLQASQLLKTLASSITSAHKCELTPLPATADPLTRAASQVTDVSICLGGQPAETLGHKIANQGNIRALERQATLGLFGHGDKAAAITKATDPKFAGSIDFAVQQVVNNFSKNDIAAEIARERNTPGQPPPAPPMPVATAEALPASQPPPAASTGSAGDFSIGLGLPTLHTSRTPDKGCHWTPFVSTEAHLALLVEQCAGAGAGQQSQDVTHLVSAYKAGTQTEIIVFTKPAEQTLDAAARLQINPHLKPAARLACHIVSEKEPSPAPDWQWHGFHATSGPLMRQYKTQEISDGPCDPWEQPDTTVGFLYKPAESRIHFLWVQLGQETPAWDVESIQFLP